MCLRKQYMTQFWSVEKTLAKKEVGKRFLIFIPLLKIVSNDLCLRQELHFQHKRKYADASLPFPNVQLPCQHHCDAPLTSISTLSTTITSNLIMDIAGYFVFHNNLTHLTIKEQFWSVEKIGLVKK